MLDICLLYAEKQQASRRRYAMSSDMIKDLNLPVILHAMAKGDETIYNTCQQVLLTPITTEPLLRYRQQMVNDAVHHFEFYTEIYRLASSAVTDFEKHKTKKGGSNTGQIYDTLQLLLVMVDDLVKVRSLMQSKEAEQSDGMMKFAERLHSYYSDEFVEELRQMAEHMSFLMRGGRLVMTAGISGGLKCGDVVINRLEPVDYRKLGSFRRMLRWVMLHLFSPNAIMLSETSLRHDARRMEENGFLYTLKIYQKFIQELESFFEELRTQAGFYVGCANLYRSLSHLHMRVSFPKVSGEKNHLQYQNLYELSLALQTLKKPVSNDLIDDCHLHVISGANQGGKSTFLRSVGIAQVLMQAGMFVPATYYEGPLYDTILTHFTRREDCSMNSGRLVEEMKWMNRIVDIITDESLILLNESFSSTTEKEGSQIAENIIQAMYDSGVQIMMVTHLFEFASNMYGKNLPHARFLSAERKEDGTRTFKIIDHEPTETSYGLDLFEEIVLRK